MLIIFFLVVIFFGVFLNFIIVFIVYCCFEMWIFCNLFIVNIVISDLVVVFLVVFLCIIEVFVGWLFGEFLCCFFVFM